MALSHPGTQHALVRYRRHWNTMMRICLTAAGLAGVGILGSLVWLVVRPDRGTPDIAGLVVFVSFLVAFVSGVVAVVAWGQLRASNRIEWTLAHYPWLPRPRYHVRVGGKRQIVLIEADEVGPEARCQLFGGSGPGWSSAERLRAGSGHQPLLVAGDPLQWAVGSTADMGDLFTLRPVRFLG